MSQRSSSLGISNPPLNGCGSGTQMCLESPGETFGSRTRDLSPQQAPHLNLTSSVTVTLWTSPPGSLRPHEDGSALLHWEDAVLISERLVTNDSWFSCLFAIVYTCPPKWSTLPSSWVTRSLSVSLATAKPLSLSARSALVPVEECGTRILTHKQV